MYCGSVCIPNTWNHPQRSPSRCDVLLKHGEDERDEAIECYASGQLPRDDDGDTHGNEQKKQLYALCKMGECISRLWKRDGLCHTQLCEGYQSCEEWKQVCWVSNAERDMP